MHEATTVHKTETVGKLDFFNVGTAVLTDAGAVFTIGDHHLMVTFAPEWTDTTEVMQKFSDLLTDLGV